MANKKIVINSNLAETRIALVEDGQLIELFIERDAKQRLVGNIYKGTVSRVLPGMNSAFIDIGLNRTAFLFGGDVIDPNAEYLPYENLEDSDDKKPQNTPTSIEKVLKDGQEIIVQVSKEALGTKGPRVSMFLTLPGRYLVLMPYFPHIGISRRIEDEQQREQLKAVAEALVPEGMGVIIRTAASGVEKTVLEEDIRTLIKDWQIISKKIPISTPPEVLFQELDLAKRVTRDLYDEEVEEIVVDNEIVFNGLRQFLSDYMPQALDKISYYSKPVPIFDVYGIEIDIGRALARRVEMPSGGFVVIDQTEALTTFDVNTGKFVGHANAQDTILKTNLEAIKVIVEQLRLRNIGGIIVVDFIDMEILEHRDIVYEKLLEALKADRSRTNVLKVSDLGLVQMTRKRTSESLEQLLLQPCPHCQGTAKVRKTETEAHDLLRELVRYSNQTNQKQIKVRARHDIQEFISVKLQGLFDLITSERNLEVEFVNCELTTHMLREPSFEVGVD